MFSRLHVVVYCFLDNYVCIEYFFHIKMIKASLSHREFEHTSYDELSVIGITEMFYNIVSCYGFVQEDIPTVILM